MTEQQQFIESLERMQCPFDLYEGERAGPFSSRDNVTTVIGVSQAWFWFDKDGAFVAVKDDEMGNVHERITAQKVSAT